MHYKSAISSLALLGISVALVGCSTTGMYTAKELGVSEERPALVQTSTAMVLARRIPTLFGCVACKDSAVWEDEKDRYFGGFSWNRGIYLPNGSGSLPNPPEPKWNLSTGPLTLSNIQIATEVGGFGFAGKGLVEALNGHHAKSHISGRLAVGLAVLDLLLEPFADDGRSANTVSDTERLYSADHSHLVTYLSSQPGIERAEIDKVVALLSEASKDLGYEPYGPIHSDYRNDRLVVRWQVLVNENKGCPRPKGQIKDGSSTDFCRAEANLLYPRHHRLDSKFVDGTRILVSSWRLGYAANVCPNGGFSRTPIVDPNLLEAIMRHMDDQTLVYVPNGVIQAGQKPEYKPPFVQQKGLRHYFRVVVPRTEKCQ